MVAVKNKVAEFVDLELRPFDWHERAQVLEGVIEEAQYRLDVSKAHLLEQEKRRPMLALTKRNSV
jgi:hypothetical protein